MSERWIDGYNVMHRLPEIAGMLADQPEEGRALFLRRLAPLVFRSRESWTVVFDAPRQGRGSAAGPIHVVYTQDADGWIIARLREHAHPGQVTVVTSDEQDIGRAARELGARVLSADDLVAALEKRQSALAPPERPEKPETVSDEERDFWLDQFGGGGSGEPRGGL